jgi:magnesium transporter
MKESVGYMLISCTCSQVCAILSSIFLQEKLSLFGWLGCALCILGSTIIALNGPDQHASGQIKEFEKLFIAPGFLVWTGVCIATALGLIFFVVPKYGKKNMLVHISICSVIGGLSVSVTSGLGSAILLSIRGQNQFVSVPLSSHETRRVLTLLTHDNQKNWFIYFLFGFVIVTLLTEIVSHDGLSRGGQCRDSHILSPTLDLSQ